MIAVRWYLRYGLSYRDVEELPSSTGIIRSSPIMDGSSLDSGPCVTSNGSTRPA